MEINGRSMIRSGLGYGACLAMCMSWGLHHDILLAIVHGFCSWFYIIVWAVT